MHEKYAIASMSVIVGKVSSPIRPPGIAPLASAESSEGDLWLWLVYPLNQGAYSHPAKRVLLHVLFCMSHHGRGHVPVYVLFHVLFHAPV